MKTNEEKQLDSVVSKAIQKAAVKSPSDDFTQNLMHKINAAHASQTTIVYQPLISRQVWAFLGVAFLLLIGYVSIQNIGLTAVSDFIQETSVAMPTWEFPSFDLSVANTSPFVYGALVLAGFLVVEIIILKQKYS
jgi:hypothetical protein